MWLSPNVSWKSYDYYNIEDWQRVRSNLEHLRSMMLERKMVDFELLETDTGKGCDEMPYVYLVNNMEQNLKNLQNIFGVDFTEDVAPKVWYERLDSLYSVNPTYKDWTRWETVLLRIYESIQYIDTYVFGTVSGPSKCGSDRTVIRFSRGR